MSPPMSLASLRAIGRPVTSPRLLLISMQGWNKRSFTALLKPTPVSTMSNLSCRRPSSSLALACSRTEPIEVYLSELSISPISTWRSRVASVMTWRGQLVPMSTLPVRPLSFARRLQLRRHVVDQSVQVER